MSIVGELTVDMERIDSQHSVDPLRVDHQSPQVRSPLHVHCKIVTVDPLT